MANRNGTTTAQNDSGTKRIHDNIATCMFRFNDTQRSAINVRNHTQAWLNKVLLLAILLLILMTA